jgi:hypothetical protein
MHLRYGLNGRLLRALGPVFAAALFSVSHAGTIQYAADDMVTNARKIPHAAAPDHHRAVFLQVVIDAADVGRDFLPLVSRTRAIFRRAELGFLGVWVRTIRHTPRFCGDPVISETRFLPLDLRLFRTN